MSEINRRWMLQHSLAAGFASAVSTAPATGEAIPPSERAAMAAAAKAFMDEYEVPGRSVAMEEAGEGR